jgi:hypothetical protein
MLRRFLSSRLRRRAFLSTQSSRNDFVNAEVACEMPDGITLVNDESTGRQALEVLMGAAPGSVFACDTEVNHRLIPKDLSLSKMDSI